MNAKKISSLLFVIFIFLLSGCVAPSYYGGMGYSRATVYYPGAGYYGGSGYYGGFSSGYSYRPSIYLNQRYFGGHRHIHGGHRHFDHAYRGGGYRGHSHRHLKGHHRGGHHHR